MFGEEEDERVQSINSLPQSADVTKKGDILLVIGEEEDIERLANEE